MRFAPPPHFVETATEFHEPHNFMPTRFEWIASSYNFRKTFIEYCEML